MVWFFHEALGMAVPQTRYQASQMGFHAVQTGYVGNTLDRAHG
jgi:hypothetical protein